MCMQNTRNVCQSVELKSIQKVAIVNRLVNLSIFNQMYFSHTVMTPINKGNRQPGHHRSRTDCYEKCPGNIFLAISLTAIL